MKSASLAPMFVHLYPRLAEAARAKGYALAVHGTLGRDYDLIAAPWTAEAAPAEELVDALVEASGGYRATQFRETDGGEFQDLPVRRPHGRLGWLIYFRGGTGYIDLAVMPRAEG